MAENKTFKIYRTIDIARKAGIHVNTVRFYERIELIAPVPRDKNNYRIYSFQHLVQVLVLRHLYLDEWPGKAVRNASKAIINAMKDWDIALAKKAAREYQNVIRQEIRKATNAISIIKRWHDQKETKEPELKLDFNEVSGLIGVSRETIRGWERNGLIQIPRSGLNNSRYFTPKECNRLKVIYLLRQARFSISAIHKAFRLLEQGKAEQAIQSLETPTPDFVYSTGDHVLEALMLTRKKARALIRFLATIS